MRRATHTFQALGLTNCFNSRPSCDGRHGARFSGKRSFRFNSRPSCDGRLLSLVFGFLVVVSIHARRATGDAPRAADVEHPLVSIHARRATGDSIDPSPWPCSPCFNSRPSCDGRLVAFAFMRSAALFQFTPVVRRATECEALRAEMEAFQFTPVVRRATGDLRQSGCGCVFQFTPVVRRATPSFSPLKGFMVFQFTPVVRRATTPGIKLLGGKVSIHARRATGDRRPSLRRPERRRFNSRPSCDGRQAMRVFLRTLSISFNSRPSCDGRPSGLRFPDWRGCFNSRPSCDGRPKYEE